MRSEDERKEIRIKKDLNENEKKIHVRRKRKERKLTKYKIDIGKQKKII